MKLSFDKKLYPLDAVLGASFTFIDKFYLLLDMDDQGKITVKIEPKQDVDVDEKALQGEFQNELLNQVMRIKTAKKMGDLRDMIIERALIGAAPSLITAAPAAG
ncbi:MAG: His-Xaa-Ser system protein HxsD, partial [Deltaproteobacteria bacterium]|nr:His-Xaa-Ser system protein HxsD [Deltaproteobacteria bacterium]